MWSNADTKYLRRLSEAASHASVTMLLDRWHPWAARIWEATTITVDGIAVGHNAHIGVKISF